MNFIWFFGSRTAHNSGDELTDSDTSDSGSSNGSTTGDDSTDEEESSEETGNGLEIIVKNLMGEKFTLETNSTDTITETKAKIEEKGWSPISMLLFEGDELDREYRTLSDYKIQNGSTIFAIYRVHENMKSWSHPENEDRLKANKTIKIWFD